ncbi:bleomycin resistance protein [Methylobacterium sp. Leaf399]|uniref:bleomycin resistance protein n=1 Tax=Methylobacterium sp. Leaf399 TaxID=1736364 RepID=UPI003FCCC01B
MDSADPVRLLLPEGMSTLVPELDVRDLAGSLAFWCDGLGFRVAYARPEDGFAFLEREGAQVMLCRANGNWGTAALEPPLGRGINLQVTVAAIAPLLTRLDTLCWPLFRAPHEARYRVGSGEVTLRQFLVQDPDGYLLRFAQTITPGEPASSR